MRYTETYNDVIEVAGADELRKKLDSLMLSDPHMEEKVRDIVRTVLKESRKILSNEAFAGLHMQSDPRESYRAVRSMVYRQILGGNVNILRKKKAGSPHDTWFPSSHTGRGGNRRPRTYRTKRLQGYWGADRGFILRFLNQGTTQRAIKYLELTPRADYGYKSRWVARPDKYGNRGSIAARNWFGGASLRTLERAAEELTNKIDNLIYEKFRDM